jgi:hypothetical protein
VEILIFTTHDLKKTWGATCKKTPKELFFKKIDQCHDHNIFQVENSQTTIIKKFNKN